MRRISAGTRGGRPGGRFRAGGLHLRLTGAAAFRSCGWAHSLRASRVSSYTERPASPGHACTSCARLQLLWSGTRAHTSSSRAAATTPSRCSRLYPSRRNSTTPTRGMKRAMRGRWQWPAGWRCAQRRAPLEQTLGERTLGRTLEMPAQPGPLLGWNRVTGSRWRWQSMARGSRRAVLASLLRARGAGRPCLRKARRAHSGRSIPRLRTNWLLMLLLRLPLLLLRLLMLLRLLPMRLPRRERERACPRVPRLGSLPSCASHRTPRQDSLPSRGGRSRQRQLCTQPRASICSVGRLPPPQPVRRPSCTDDRSPQRLLRWAQLPKRELQPSRGRVRPGRRKPPSRLFHRSQPRPQPRWRVRAWAWLRWPGRNLRSPHVQQEPSPPRRLGAGLLLRRPQPPSRPA
mmetsp:Transcript_20818/g.52835  ORF Transcript_20818/g.52835 Transcript_20818/m.52835 type:complete len:402 (-) Transcript_20818:173-1378(-)